MNYDTQWFHELNKPFLNPPDSVFTPVWIILYIFMAISLFLFLKGGMTQRKIVPLIFFFVQLILNLSWSPVFFGMHNITGALVIILFMWLFTLLTIITFIFHSKTAALLLVPYLFWLSFAFYLNLGYFVLNK